MKETQESASNLDKYNERDYRKSSSRTGLMALFYATTMGWVADYLYPKNNKKKSGPDPDADYTDEEENFCLSYLRTIP